MSHIPAEEFLATKPVETIHPDSLPETKDPSDVAVALQQLVEQSEKHPDVKNSTHAPMHMLQNLPLVHKLVPGLERLANDYHVGNFVIVRATGERIFESMPIYPRLGMHLLFYGGTQIKLLHNHSVETVLKDLSERQGKIYDSPESVKSIPSFMETYSITTDELLQPDISKYGNFNEFFSRKLKPDARPVENADDSSGICSAADCRLTVFPTVSAAKEFWIKGKNFTIATLLGVKPESEEAHMFENGSIAIFRLAPADYHRFHSPIDGVVGDYTDIPGQYYTVNPQAVNESGFDVFTDNKRSVLYMTHLQSGAPIAFVAIGAMLVGGICWTTGGKNGTTVKRGEELGYFAYGGSTVVALFPKGLMQFDDDLLKNSSVPVETLVKVGNSLGHSLLPANGFNAEEILGPADASQPEEGASEGRFAKLKRLATHIV